MKINLNIEASSATELQEAVATLASAFGGDGFEAEAGEATGAAPATTGRGRGRPRRTDASPVTAASGAPATQESPGAAAGQTATTAASPSEPAAGGPVTKEQVQAAMTQAISIKDPLTLQQGLEALNLPKRLSEMTEAQYPAALAYFQKVVSDAQAMA